MTVKDITDAEIESMYLIGNSHRNLWEAFNLRTGEPVSPQFSHRESLMWYLKNELLQQLNETVEDLLVDKR